MFFVPGTSWVGIDNNKVPNFLRKWKEYGIWTVPTKDNKLNPVFRVMATVGTGFIWWFAPEKIGMQLRDIMHNTIIDICPSFQTALRASLAFFIDRGYLDLDKHQMGTVTNLIQIIQQHGVKFLGTINNSNAFPFEFVEVNENVKQVNNGKYVVQTFGTRTNLVSRSLTDQNIWM